MEKTTDSYYGANELTCAVKSIVNPHLVIRKNETTYGKKSKTNITNELTPGEAERRQADDECTKKHHKHKVTMVC